jgi:putative permease
MTNSVDFSLKRLAVLAAAALGTVALFVILYAFRNVVVLFVAALTLAATTRPLANRLRNWGLPRWLAALLMVLLVFVGLLALLGLSGYVLAEDLPRAAMDFQLRYAEIRADLEEGAPWQQGLASRLPQVESLEDLLARIQWGALEAEAGSTQVTVAEEALSGEVPAETAPVATPSAAGVAELAANTTDPAAPDLSERRAAGLLRVVVGTTSSLAAVLTQLVLLVFLSLYWSLENESFERLWLSLFAPERRARARRTWHAVEEGVGTHLRSELVQFVLAFLLLWASFWALGVSYPLLLAWLCALVSLIPLVGWLAALVPVVLVSLLSGPMVAAGAVIAMTVVFVLMEFVVEPRLDIRRRAGSILGLVVALILLEAFGILGLLLASTVAVALAAFFGNAFALETEVGQAERTSAEALAARMAELRAAMGRVEGEIPHRTRNLYERLQELASQAERAL